MTMLFAAPAWAQESQEEVGGQGQGAAISVLDPTYDSPYVWYVSFGAGGVSGGNPIGSIVDEEAETIFTFDFGKGSFFSGRAGRRIWWRLGVEVEVGYGSPGLEVTETNLAGRDIETSDFGDYSFLLVAGSARLDLTDSLVTPFLLAGVAVVAASYVDAIGADQSDTNLGFLFGGGLDVRIKANVNFRADVRGLRSKIDAPLLSRGILVQNVEAGDALSTMWLWSFGASVRFD